MKLLKMTLTTLALLFCWMAHGYADRLYTWTDAKGVTHITQDPPPDTAKAVDTIDYSPQPNQPVRQSTASDRPNQPQGNPNQGGGRSGSGIGTGAASADGGDDVEYDYTGGPYRRTLRQYERRGERLDNNAPGKEGDLPVRVQPRSRRR
jgi:hypothetical protein